MRDTLTLVTLCTSKEYYKIYENKLYFNSVLICIDLSVTTEQ